MSKFKRAAYAVAILAAVTASAAAQPSTQAGIAAAIPDGKVVVLNTLVFDEQIGEWKQKTEQLRAQFGDRFQKLSQMDQQLKQKENELQTQRAGLSPDAFAQKQGEYEEMKKRFTRDYEDYQGEVQRAQVAAFKPLEDKMRSFITSYAQQRGIVMIINLAGVSQTRSLAFWDPKADITEDFVREYNKANPVPTAAAPAKPK